MTSHDECAAMWGEPTAPCTQTETLLVFAGDVVTWGNPSSLGSAANPAAKVCPSAAANALQVWRTEAYLVQKPPQVKGPLFLQCNSAHWQSEFLESSSNEWWALLGSQIPSELPVLPKLLTERSQGSPLQSAPSLPSHLPSFLRKGWNSALPTTALTPQIKTFWSFSTKLKSSSGIVCLVLSGLACSLMYQNKGWRILQETLT